MRSVYSILGGNNSQQKFKEENSSRVTRLKVDLNLSTSFKQIFPIRSNLKSYARKINQRLHLKKYFLSTQI